MKKYSVNCHYDMVITVDVLAESEEQALELAQVKADRISMNEAECLGHNECVTDIYEFKVPEQLKGKPSFKYQGFTFIPAGQFKDYGIADIETCSWKTINSRLNRDFELGMWLYDDRKIDWSHKDFYSASTDKDADVFYLLEMERYYCPCGNELFMFKL